MKQQIVYLALSAAIVTSTPLFAMDEQTDLQETQPNKTIQAISLEDMPHEIILKTVNTYSSEENNDHQKNMYKLGKVSKKFYGIYLSQYVVGDIQNIGTPYTGQVINSIRTLLGGTPVNFRASSGVVGSFDFKDLFESMSLRLDGWNVNKSGTLSAVLPKSGYYPNGHELQISNEKANLLTQENKAWPFNAVSKVSFSQYVSGAPSAQDFYPNEPEKWNDPMYQFFPCGTATYTIEGTDNSGQSIKVSYSFYKPTI